MATLATQPGVQPVGSVQSGWSNPGTRYSAPAGYGRPKQAAGSSASSSRNLILGLILGMVFLGIVAVVSIVGLTVVVAMQLMREPSTPVAANPTLIAPAPVAENSKRPFETTQIPGLPSSPAPATPAPVTKTRPTPGNSVPVTGGPGVAVAALPAIKANAALSYAWQPKLNYSYLYNLSTESGPAKTTFNGSVNYKLNENSSTHLARLVEMEANATGTPREGTGTAFVVHPDGLLVTCAHVVHGANKVIVSLGGREFAGEVVGLDNRHDLALIRIPAKSLPAIRLADSDQVQLAQEVRALGFPLSNVLGTSIKVTRGTVSGLVTQKENKLLQIDASINPGNSGGPLVNERGEVVGINSAVYLGEDVSSVGFAVPANDARKLLESVGVAPTTGPVGPVLDGPALVQAVAPSTALVRVDLGSNASLLALEFNGFCSSSTPSRNPYGGGLAMPRHLDDRGAVVMSRSGEVLKCPMNVELPFMLMPLAQVPLERLSSGGEREWENRRMRALAFTAPGSGSSGVPGYGLDPRRSQRYPGMSPPENRAVVVIPALEHVKYKIVAESDETIEIEKTVELATVEGSGQPPKLQILGTGKLIWDKRQGVPGSLKQSLTMAMGAGNVRVALPLEFDFRLYKVRTDEQINEDVEKYKAERAVAGTNTMEKAIEALKAAGGAPEKVHLPLMELRNVEPVPARRDEVSALIEPILSSPDERARRAATQLAEKWGTARNIASLLKLFESSIPSERRDALEDLGAIGGSREVAALVAKNLSNPKERYQTGKALKSMGSIAEDAVLPFIETTEDEVFTETMQVLGEIGTEKSLARIKALNIFQGSNRHVWVRLAISKIERRVNKK